MTFGGCIRADGAVRVRAFSLGSLLLLAVASSALLASPNFARQDGKHADETQPDLKAFVGTWKAAYHGDVFAVLTLKEQDGKLSGTLNNFDIGVDKDGNLDDDTHIDDGDAPLLNVHFKSGALYFVVLEKDQYRDGMNWKFVPLNAQEGELTPVLDHQEDAPRGLVIKPLHMLRDRAKH